VDVSKGRVFSRNSISAQTFSLSGLKSYWITCSITSFRHAVDYWRLKAGERNDGWWPAGSFNTFFFFFLLFFISVTRLTGQCFKGVSVPLSSSHLFAISVEIGISRMVDKSSQPSRKAMGRQCEALWKERYPRIISTHDRDGIIYLPFSFLLFSIIGR